MRWGTQLERGYTTVFAVRIAGIPVRWIERPLARAASDTVPSATSGIATSPALVITESSVISWDLDRQSGLAAGRALDLNLDLDVMGSTLRALFTRPALKARLTADIPNPATTTIAVASTTGWPSSGTLWLGRECCTYTGTTATAFTGVTRGVAGAPDYHVSNTASGYGYATDQPIYWAGRLVEVWEYLIAPDGRFVGTSWEDADYAGRVWVGEVSEPPEITGRLVRLRCLTIERRFEKGLGTSAEGKSIVGDVRLFLGSWMRLMVADIYTTSSDKLVVVRESDGDSVQVPFDGPLGPTTVERWGEQAMADALTHFGVSFFGSLGPAFASSIGDRADGRWLRTLVPDGFRVESRAWFCGEMIRDFDHSEGVPTELYRGRLLPDGVPLAWVFLSIGLDVIGNPEAWPSSGYGILESGGIHEVVGWDEADLTFATQGIVAIRLHRRQLAGTRRADPWGEKATITTIAGHIGTVEEALRTLATSSGTGARGTYDTLPFGYGYALQDSLLDFDAYPMNSVVVDALGEGGSSAEELLGGWLALWQRSICQVQVGAAIQLQAVETTVIDGARIPTLAASDIILGQTASQGLMESPNVVVIDRGVLGSDDKIEVRDAPRVQAEGRRQWEMTAPGMKDSQAVGAAVDIMSMSDGQQAIRVGVRPAFVHGIGALVRITADHPEAYDWGTGDTADDELGRIVGYERNLYTGETWRTILMPGQADSLFPLCPSARVEQYLSTTQFRITGYRLTGFGNSSKIRIYRAGEEDTYSIDRTVSGIVASGSDWLVTVTVAITAVDYPVGSWVTFSAYGLDVEQDRHLYFDEGEFR